MADPTTTKTAPKTAAEPKESAREHFVKLANKRANRVLDALDILGNCSNPGYEYGPQDVAALFGTIGEALNACKARFDQPTTSKRAAVQIVK